MNDESIMPFGKHKGKEMINIPDDYLLWFWNQNKASYQRAVIPSQCHLPKDVIEIMIYIEESFNEKDLK